MRFWKFISICLLCILFATVANAKIVFLSKRDNHNEVEGLVFRGFIDIYTMDDDGSNLTSITSTHEAGSPRWSSDRKQIIYRDHSAIHIINSDGTNIQHITHPQKNIMFDDNPIFSPDGQKILYVRSEIIGNNTVHSGFVLNLKNGNQNKISDQFIISPDWSPNGKQIVYLIHDVPFIGAGGNLYVMDSDGGNKRRLVPEAVQGELAIERHNPRWSPNGKQILYTQREFTLEKRDAKPSTHIPKAFRYFICDLNGETVNQLDIPIDWKPGSIDWIDNGKSVVFSAQKIKLNEQRQPNEAALSNIYKYHIATKKITSLLERPRYDYAVDWVPDSPFHVSPKGKLAQVWGAIKQHD